jgi:hypothetical protein
MTVTTAGVPMAGMYAIQTNAPYIDPKSGIKRKPIKKTSRSPFMNKLDAGEQHIKGEMDNAGKRKSKIEEKIDNRMKGIND